MVETVQTTILDAFRGGNYLFEAKFIDIDY